MKYYKNLIIRKKFGVLFKSLILALLGFTCFYYNSIDVIINGINSSDIFHNPITDSYGLIINLFSSTNIGLSLIGLFLIYSGIVFIPFTSPFAQDDSDYKIISKGDYIYIKYIKNEFYVKKESFQATDLFFKDKNRHFITMTRGYQIYNYVKDKYNDLTEKEIKDVIIIDKSEVTYKFSNVKMLSNQEKEEYLKKINIKNKPRVFFIILSVFLWINFAFWSCGIIMWLCGEQTTVSNIIISAIICFFSFFFGKKSNMAIMKNKNFMKNVMKKNMYIVECTVFDRKVVDTHDNSSNHTYYYVKITDGTYLVNKWIQIPRTLYKNENNYKINVYIMDEKANDIFAII